MQQHGRNFTSLIWEADLAEEEKEEEDEEKEEKKIEHSPVSYVF